MSDSGARELLLTRAGVGWFLCDAGGGGHAAATTSGVATTTVDAFATVGAGGSSTTSIGVFATVAKSPPPAVVRGYRWRCRFGYARLSRASHGVEFFDDRAVVNGPAIPQRHIAVGRDRFLCCAQTV